MLQRRTLLSLTSAAVVSTARHALADSETDRAAAFVKVTGDKLVAVVNGPGSAQEKRATLTRVIEGAVDVDGVARFSLGRFWRTASSEQQQHYTQLFHQVLVTNITAKLGEYRGVTFAMGRTQQRDDTEVVSTVVTRPNSPPTNVDWIIVDATRNPKIIDVVAEGTSLRLTQRSDYASYMAHNNNSIDALISAMRQQVGPAS